MSFSEGRLDTGGCLTYASRISRAFFLNSVHLSKPILSFQLITYVSNLLLVPLIEN